MSLNFEYKVKGFYLIFVAIFSGHFLKVSYVFRSLLNPNILHLNLLIGLFRYIHD